MKRLVLAFSCAAFTSGAAHAEVFASIDCSEFGEFALIALDARHAGAPIGDLKRDMLGDISDKSARSVFENVIDAAYALELETEADAADAQLEGFTADMISFCEKN